MSGSSSEYGRRPAALPLSDRKIGLFMEKQSIRALFLKESYLSVALDVPEIRYVLLPHGGAFRA